MRQQPFRDIIRETELAAGTFYNYFKSKEEVFEAISTDSVRRFRPLLEEVRDNAQNFEEYIRGAYGAYFKFLKEENDEAIRHARTTYRPYRRSRGYTRNANRFRRNSHESGTCCDWR